MFASENVAERKPSDADRLQPLTAILGMPRPVVSVYERRDGATRSDGRVE